MAHAVMQFRESTAISSAGASHEVLGLSQFAPFVNLPPPSFTGKRTYCNPFPSHISAQNGGYDNERSISASLPFLQELTLHHQNLTILAYLETATTQVCPIARSRPTNVTGADSREGVRPHSSTTRDLRLIRVFIGHRNLFCNIFVNFWKLPLKFERSLSRGGWASEWRSHEPLPRQFHRMSETSEITESSFWKWQLYLHCPAKCFEVGGWLFCVHETVRTRVKVENCFSRQLAFEVAWS